MQMQSCAVLWARMQQGRMELSQVCLCEAHYVQHQSVLPIPGRLGTNAGEW